MKILMVSTLKRAVAPDIFASRSRIIYQLAEALQKRGHTVALLGTKDSLIPGVKIIPVADTSWNNLPPVENPFLRQVSLLMQQAYKIVELQKDFDIIHNHTYPEFFPHIIEAQLQIPLVSTLHAVADYYIEDVLANFHKSYFVALSKAYTKYFKKNYFYEVIYNGVNTSLYSLSKRKKDYLLWLGRLPAGKNRNGTFIDPKGVRWAIKVAQLTKRKLFLAGTVENQDFFDLEVKPHLNQNIQWVGKVSVEQSLPVEKIISLMQQAKAFLMTVNQEEPFGLVMAEAMACGTPVIAYAKGATSEIVKDNETGFLVNPKAKVAGLCQAVEHIYSMDKKTYQQMQKAGRKRVKDNFSVDQMVTNYEKVYQDLIKTHLHKTSQTTT